MRCNTPAIPHNLDEMAEAIVRESLPTLQPELKGMTRELYLRRSHSKPGAYVEVFIEAFLVLTQQLAHWRRQVLLTLFHALDKVFRPCDSVNLTNSK